MLIGRYIYQLYIHTQYVRIGYKAEEAETTPQPPDSLYFYVIKT